VVLLLAARSLLAHMWSLTLLALAPASALRAPAVISSRRAAIGGATAAIFAAPLQAYAAVKPCPPDANNCWSTASTGKTALAPWKWPQEVDRTKAIGQLRAALEAYPQAGQAGVDLGGWTVVDDSLDSSGYQRVEFKSGLGNFAKFFNGGKPFVDDLEFSVDASSVSVRSSSRVGDSDFGVNGKRLSFIAAELAKSGWSAKGPAA